MTVVSVEEEKEEVVGGMLRQKSAKRSNFRLSSAGFDFVDVSLHPQVISIITSQHAPIARQSCGSAVRSSAYKVKLILPAKIDPSDIRIERHRDSAFRTLMGK